MKSKRKKMNDLEDTTEPLLSSVNPGTDLDNDLSLISSNSDSQQGNNDHNISSESDLSDGYGTDSSPEEDIDDLVAQYKEQVKVGTMDSGAPKTPTPGSARRAAICVLSLTATLGMASIIIIHAWRFNVHHSAVVAFLCVLGGFSMVFILLLVKLPIVKPPQGQSFKVVASPWLPAATLFLNLLLVTQVLSTTWIFLLIFIFVGK